MENQINRVQKENLVKQFEIYLEGVEGETKPLTESEKGSNVRLVLDDVADKFWQDLKDECVENNLSFELEWGRIKANLSQRYYRSYGRINGS